MTTKNTKRLIHLSKEQEEKMAAQSAQKIQAFIGEANQIQARRCEVMVALLAAEVTKNGVAATTEVEVEKARTLAHLAVDADARQKWNDLKKLFVELGVHGPQPHLEWAAKQLGITLFDEPAESEGVIIEATAAEVAKVAH